MEFRYDNLRIAFDNSRDIIAVVSKKIAVKPAAINDLRIIKRSLDARDKKNICFVYSIVFAVYDIQLQRKLLNNKLVKKNALPETDVQALVGEVNSVARPVVVGFGPAGMFAAYYLAKNGYRPIIYERGSDVDTRAEKIAEFWKTGQLDNNCNVQFGEGGAGTFSDGKLTCRLNDPAINEILRLFVECGAPEEIIWLQKPHIGTDVLRTVVKNLRSKILALGGEINFDSSLQSLNIIDGAIAGIVVNNEKFSSNTVFLGIGHSARDTYEMLHKCGVAIVTKPFSVGVRIEHPQTMIDKAQFGAFAGHPRLGSADYALVYHDKTSGRTVYSFCMCPGGQVIAATSEQNSVVVNGMSNYRRDSGIANSALVVTVDERDFGSQPLDGIAFQRQLEQAAFLAGGENYYAPIQTVGSFLFGEQASKIVEPSYLPGTVDCDLRSVLPQFVADTLARALVDFGRKINGYDNPGAVMTAVETRTSAPCRIVRNADFQSSSTCGLYPIGEGAGYAGGIMSAALDGINAVKAFMNKQ
ncbi:MAG: hypothetical protein WCV63_09455 [Negativicutes bacterium]